MVEVSERTRVTIAREILPQPFALVSRPMRVDHAVESDDVPAPEIVTVIALAFLAGGGAKVVEVLIDVAFLVLVIAGHGTNARPVSTPRCPEAGERLMPLGPVCVVSHREHGPANAVEQ